MSSPDFSSHGYQVIRELGRNYEGGRITYLCNAVDQQQVVIKQFCFALASTSWTGFKAHEREIQILRELNHPRIPRYLDVLDTPEGFCMVQEYKNAPSLTERRSFNPEQVEQIAVSVLEILVDLQKRVPPVIHRDIKPENILVDEQLNAYLIDFGFARIRGGQVALSSVAAGTPGFMPPEELFNRPLTEASDLYSLGATLICLLTGTRSVDIGELIDDNYRLNFKGSTPQLSPPFIRWLEKMVAPNVKDRYPNAIVALEELKQIRVLNSAIGLGTIVRAIKLRMPVTIQRLVITSVVIGVGTNFIIYQQGSSVRHLLATRECVGCNLENANLGNADLRGASLRGANLERANLGNADLRGANLGGANWRNQRGANLERANLNGANLGGANLMNVNLNGANLTNANLTNANLNGANLTNANLGGAILATAQLLMANLKHASLERAILVSTYLTGANLEGANLRSADLRGADLEAANMVGANLERADLGNANLERAKLVVANLGGTYLKGANLRGANVGGASLVGASLVGAILVSTYLKGANLEGANLKDTKLEETLMPDRTNHK